MSMGGVTQVQENCRQVGTIGWLASLLQDLRYGVRVLAGNPGFTLVAVLTLAMGIGANTSIFSVVNAVLLRPLPYHDADRIMMLWQANPDLGYEEDLVAPIDMHEWERHSRTFERFGYIANNTPAVRNFQLDLDGRSVRVRGRFTSAGVFDVLGVQPLLGRTIREEESVRGEERTAVLSYGFWQRTFGGDPEVLGRTLQAGGWLHQQTAAVVGVMPPEFRFPEDCDVWFSFSAHPFHTSDRVSHDFWVVGRLQPGVTIAEAQSEMDGLQQRLAESHPESLQVATRVKIVPLLEQFVGSGTRPTLLILLSAVGGVLLIACANLANLLLARALSRRKEIGVRLAVGAGRRRVLRQLLTESLLLSVLGGIAGGLLAVSGVRFLPAFSVQTTGGVKEFRVDRFQEVGIDLTVLAFTVVTAVATSILFGLAPAVQGSRIDLNACLKEEGRSTTDTAGRHRMRNGLLVGQIALAMMLVVWAGLMIRSFQHALDIELGYQPSQVLAAGLDLAAASQRNSGTRQDVTFEIMERARAVPGVQSVSSINELQTRKSGIQLILYIEGQPELPDGELPTIHVRVSTPDYFETLGIPLLEGRGHSENDTAGSPPVVLINETAARRFFPNESPLGKRVITASTAWPVMQQPFQEIVGVVGDFRTFNPDHEVNPEVYWCYRQRTSGHWGGDEHATPILIRTTSDPERVVDALRHAIEGDAESGRILQDCRPLQSRVDETARSQRFRVVLMSLFSVLALTLAAIGLYGVMSNSVNQRIRELGIRMALGATPGRVLWLVVGQGLKLMLLGIGIGLCGTLAVGRVLSSVLYGVDPYDPLTLAVVSLILLLVGLTASYVPARRAMRINPMEALSYE